MSATEGADDPRPFSRLTPRVRRDVLVDRLAYRLVSGRAGIPDAPEVARIDREVSAALPLFEQQGWLADPASYHRTPPPVEHLRARRKRVGGLHATALTWLDGFRCRPEEPGATRYAGFRKNRVAHAALVEHRREDRPWLICLHGFGMGSPGVDMRSFRAAHLHRGLGLNLAFLTLPFHGPRRSGQSGVPEIPGADVLDNLHGLAQAVWDARQLLRYLQERSDQPVAIMGLSLGGCIAALVASLDDPHGVLLLIPAVDFSALLVEGSERLVPPDTASIDLAERARPVLAPVTALSLTPRVPLERRFIVAGTLDRFVRPTTQAVALWRHWAQPELHWYHGGHVSLFWARGVQTAVDGALERFGMVR
jgi:pimeloyl-ACP methyl ester carboxylesterase